MPRPTKASTPLALIWMTVPLLHTTAGAQQNPTVEPSTAVDPDLTPADEDDLAEEAVAEGSLPQVAEYVEPDWPAAAGQLALGPPPAPPWALGDHF